MADEKESPTVALVLSYIGGILIVLSGFMVLWMGTAFRYGYGMMGMMYGYSPAFVGSMMTGIGVWGVICGIIILLGAWKIGSDPAGSHTTWGILILVFSVLGYFGGGGFMVGGILGIIGGILAITWKPVVPAVELNSAP